jgi:MraZ protein
MGVRMTSLRGRAHIKIDPKGRLSLPSSLRSGLGKSNKVFITNSIYQGRRFLDFYTATEWLKLEKKISLMPSLRSEVQAFQRFYISSGEECVIDAQGRILIPQHLRDYADLKDDIVLVGMVSKIEIWSHVNWQPLFRQLEKDFENVMNIISGIDEAKGSKR